jgi:tumor protein p53-inducible protein 3
VGLAAIQLARTGGAAKIIVTAGGQDKLDAAVRVGADVAISRYDNDGNWAPAVSQQIVGGRGSDGRFWGCGQQVLEATNGTGVDLILDCIGGSYVDKNVEAAAMDGVWVLYGTLGGPNVEGPLLRSLMKKRLQLRTTTLRSRPLAYKAELVRRFATEALPNFDNETMPYKIVVDRTFSLGEIAEAHAYMEANSNTGKVSLVVDEALASGECSSA